MHHFNVCSHLIPIKHIYSVPVKCLCNFYLHHHDSHYHPSTTTTTRETCTYISLNNVTVSGRRILQCWRCRFTADSRFQGEERRGFLCLGMGWVALSSKGQSQWSWQSFVGWSFLLSLWLWEEGERWSIAGSVQCYISTCNIWLMNFMGDF